MISKEKPCLAQEIPKLKIDGGWQSLRGSIVYIIYNCPFLTLPTADRDKEYLQ